MRLKGKAVNVFNSYRLERESGSENLTFSQRCSIPIQGGDCRLLKGLTQWLHKNGTSTEKQTSKPWRLQEGQEEQALRGLMLKGSSSWEAGEELGFNTSKRDCYTWGVWNEVDSWQGRDNVQEEVGRRVKKWKSYLFLGLRDKLRVSWAFLKIVSGKFKSLLPESPENTMWYIGSVWSKQNN